MSQFQYKKRSVLLIGLQAKVSVKATLLDISKTQIQSDIRMRVIDAINKKIGKGGVTIAASSTNRCWETRRDCKSSNYTTDWLELSAAW